MLRLDSARWSELKHAYGAASDIPGLLRQLDTLPESRGNAEPWYSLWSALAHQGDVYSATFAAVPYVIEALARAPDKADSTYFHFPAWVEICRVKTAEPIPEDLSSAYFSALGKLPSLVAAASVREWDESTLVCVLSAIAASKGFTPAAEAILELTDGVPEEFMTWFFSR